MNIFVELFLIFLLVVFVSVISYGSGRNSLKAESDELHRWRCYWEGCRRWLAEFPDVVIALEHLKANADGTGGTDISRTREVMRERRDRRDKIMAAPFEPVTGDAAYRGNHGGFTGGA